jgi:hypothetical protein
MDAELTFIDCLIKERRAAQRMLVALASFLFALAMVAFVAAVFGLSDKGFSTAGGTVVAIVGAIPTGKIFAVRDQAVHYEFIRNRWDEAHRNGDNRVISELHRQLVKLCQDGLKKSWWSWK